MFISKIKVRTREHFKTTLPFDLFFEQELYKCPHIKSSLLVSVYFPNVSESLSHNVTPSRFRNVAISSYLNFQMFPCPCSTTPASYVQMCLYVSKSFHLHASKQNTMIHKVSASTLFQDSVFGSLEVSVSAVSS